MIYDQLVPPPFSARGLALVCFCESYFDSIKLVFLDGFSYMTAASEKGFSRCNDNIGT